MIADLYTISKSCGLRTTLARNRNAGIIQSLRDSRGPAESPIVCESRHTIAAATHVECSHGLLLSLDLGLSQMAGHPLKYTSVTQRGQPMPHASAAQRVSVAR